MASSGEGEDLAALGVAGRSSSTSKAASLSSCIFSNPSSSELSNGQTSRMLQSDFRSSSSTSKAMLQDSAAFGLGFYNSVGRNDIFLSSPHDLQAVQAVMESPSEVRMDGLKEEDQRGEMQAGSLQLRSPVPGDTPSSYGTYNGLSLQTSNRYDSAASLQAAVGSNVSGKFSHDSSEHPLPDMPTSSSSAAGTVNSCPSLNSHNGGISDKSSAVLLSDIVAHSPYLSLPSEDTPDINMEEESDTDRRVTCLWAGCLQEFSSLTQLVVHLDRCHTLAMTQYVCLWENCPRQLKPFDARYKLTTHLRCHTGEKPYQCEVASCKRSFSRLENLKLHTRTHTGEKPYQCHHSGCTKRFNNTSDRAKHMKTHITRKPYACKHPGCNKSYTDPSSMRKHIKYSHKLKEEVEEGGLPLAGLPRRKRNSTSCSSSSSSSSAPRTPQQSTQIQQQIQGAVLLHSPPAAPLDDASKTVLQTVSFVPSAKTAPVSMCPVSDCPSLASTSSAPQIIPMVKLQTNNRIGPNGQSILVPAYQQSPVMMIVPSNIPQSSSSAGLTASSMSSSSSALTTQVVGVPTVSTESSQSLSIQQATVQPIPLAASQVLPTTFQATQHMEQSHSTTTSASLSVEDQLRLQIVHLRQQLYQSQLAAAAAAAVPPPPQTVSSPVVDSGCPVVFLQNSKSNVKPEVSEARVATALPQSSAGSSIHKLKSDVVRPGLFPESQAHPLLAAKAGPTVQGTTNILSSSSVSLPLLDTNGRNLTQGGPLLVSTSSIPVVGESSSIVEGKGTIPVSISSAPVLSVGGASAAAVPPVLTIGSTNAPMLPQFISIPVIHTKGMAPDARFIYMSS